MSGSGERPEPYDLVILGGGSAGLTGATFAAKLGARVALVEAHRIGGDCTWTGCVPSKALIKVARVLHEARRAAVFGVELAQPACDMARVRAYVRAAVEAVYARETPERLTERGVIVVQGRAAFVDARTVRVDGRALTSSRFVIATGATPRVPDLAGLCDGPFHTHESIFDNDRLPRHLLVLGGGPIGLELAQAYRRLGAEVTVVAEALLPKEVPAAREVLVEALLAEGVRCIVGTVRSVARAAADVTLHTSEGTVTGDMLLVATGRAPRVAALALERAGVAYDASGVKVDTCLRTTSPGIYAVGDVIGREQLTHLAGWQCFQAVRNALLPGNASGQPAVLPRVTFTDPEIAHVGVRPIDAPNDQLVVHRRELALADRAVCDGETRGFLEIVVTPGGKIVGATIVAPRAGEMLAELALAVRMGLSLTELASTVHAYPTYSMLVQELASELAVDEFVEGRAGKLATTLGRWLR
ncbi:MAG: FAD-dependent oxidoreductase [Polyangiaceae bacterium]|nr:FAD-dependent oxidoreductase [Polyangiaceae bacterium]